jgi:hypothetical protein
MQDLAQSNADAEAMRTRNPYIQILIDGDGMLVRMPPCEGESCG